MRPAGAVVVCDVNPTLSVGYWMYWTRPVLDPGGSFSVYD